LLCPKKRYEKSGTKGARYELGRGTKGAVRKELYERSGTKGAVRNVTKSMPLPIYKLTTLWFSVLELIVYLESKSHIS
jgi:hypothetical protein